MRFYKINSDKSVTIPPEGQSQRQLQYTSGNDTRYVYIGKSEQPDDKWTGMYHAGGFDPQLTLTPASPGWISITVGNVDDSSTGAPVYYEAQANNTGETRNVKIRLQNNNNIKFTLTQDPIPYTPPEPDPDPEPEPDTHFYMYMCSPSRFDSSLNYYKIADTSHPAGSEKYVQVYDSSHTASTINIEVQAKANTSINLSYGKVALYNSSIVNYSSYMIDPVYNTSSLLNTNIQNLSYSNGIVSFKTSNNGDYWGDSMYKDLQTYIKLNGFDEYPTLNIKIGNALIYHSYVEWHMYYSIYHEFVTPDAEDSIPLNMELTFDAPVSFQISHLRSAIEAFDHVYGYIDITIPKNKQNTRFNLVSYSVWHNNQTFNVNHVDLTINKSYNEWSQYPDRLALEIILS